MAAAAAILGGKITLDQLIGFMQTEQGKAMLTLVKGLFGSGGNFKEKLADDAEVWINVIAKNMQTNYRIITQEKYDLLVGDGEMTPGLRAKMDLALQLPEEQELFNAMMIAWLMGIVEKWDKD